MALVHVKMTDVEGRAHLARNGKKKKTKKTLLPERESRVRFLVLLHCDKGNSLGEGASHIPGEASPFQNSHSAFCWVIEIRAPRKPLGLTAKLGFQWHGF